MTNPDWAPDFDTFGEATAAEHTIPGLAVAFARDGVPVYERGFGYADVERGLPATPGTRFGVASVTKSFTALAVMQLQDAGKLSVHDPVVRYLPRFRTPDPEATRAITVHNFLTMSAGLPPLPSRWFAFARSIAEDPLAENVPVDTASRPPIDTYDDLMDYLAEGGYDLLGPPGGQFSYSNEGYALLGAVVEQASGLPYAQYVEERILKPAGMTKSGFAVEGLVGADDATTQYISRGGEERREVVAAPVWWYSEVWLPAGGLVSTVQDLLRYLEVYRTGGTVFGERLLSPEGVRQMTAAHVAQNAPDTWYGYGLAVRPDFHGATLISHGGGRKAISAEIAVLPERGITAAGLANLAEVPTATVVQAGINAMLGLPVDTPRAAYDDYAGPPLQLARYAGEYHSGEGARIGVREEDGRLILRIGKTDLPARCVGEHAFVVRQRGADAYCRFAVDAAGNVWALGFGSRLIPRSSNG